MFQLYKLISDFYSYQLKRELDRNGVTTLALTLNIKASMAFSKMIHAKGAL
jgi:hypothetical protein